MATGIQELDRPYRSELRESHLGERPIHRESRPAEHPFAEIIGQSAALTAVLTQLDLVAPTDATVLLQGETGTGKELLAHALHRLSSRHARAFVTLNCAAIPSGLLESELFGREKGAFTGALTLRLGRFELPHQGTLFLASTVSPRPQTLDEEMRAHILDVLSATNWVLGGPHGAAVRLGLKRTTLVSRMEKLGICRLRTAMA